VLGEASKTDNRSKVFNHQTAVAESINCLQWIFVSPAPGPHVQGCLEASDFYLNKVITTNKESPDIALHREFVKGIKTTLGELQVYIKQFHTTGVSWNSKGRSLAGFSGSAKSDGAAESKSVEMSVEDKIAALTERIQSITFALGKKSGATLSADGDAPSVVEFDQFVVDNVAPFIAAATKLGGSCAKIVRVFEKEY